MKLAVSVLGHEIAVLESLGDFKSVLTYYPSATPEQLVSLTMKVRTESYVWDAPLHPVFQMNLPEGYLLQVLQEALGPHVGASPVALLSVIGRNMIGRVQVAAPGANLSMPPDSMEVHEILRGDNSEEAFAELVRQHAASGVSGVVPKFLHGAVWGGENKVTVVGRQHIIKGSSAALPFVALNEYFCMQVAARILPTAKTEVSQDGRALVVHRFDVDAEGAPHDAMEDFCALLGMSPAAKYETTWERIAKAVKDHVAGPKQHAAFEHLAAVLLLTYALRNADCHAKNLALLYTSPTDARMAPVYDMLTTAAYVGYEKNPPGLAFAGKKTWKPGRTLQRFIVAILGVSVAHQNALVERISDAVADVASQVKHAMRDVPEFSDVGLRMLHCWNEGVNGLRDQRT